MLLVKPDHLYQQHYQETSDPNVNPNYIRPKMFMFRLQKIMDEYAGGVTAQFMTNSFLLEKGLELLDMLKEDAKKLAAEFFGTAMLLFPKSSISTALVPQARPMERMGCGSCSCKTVRQTSEIFVPVQFRQAGLGLGPGKFFQAFTDSSGLFFHGHLIQGPVFIYEKIQLHVLFQYAQHAGVVFFRF